MDEGESSSLSTCSVVRKNRKRRKIIQASTSASLLHKKLDNTHDKDVGNYPKSHAVIGNFYNCDAREVMINYSKGKSKQSCSDVLLNSEDNLAELIRVAETHLSSQGSKKEVLPSRSSSRHRQQDLDREGASSFPPDQLDWSSLFNAVSVNSTNSSSWTAKKAISNDPSLRCSTSSICSDCPVVPTCRVSEVPSYDQCCNVPCPVARSPPSSAQKISPCSAVPACCDEELHQVACGTPDVVTCLNAECATSTCDNARCSENSKAKVAASAVAADNSCLVVCEGVKPLDKLVPSAVASSSTDTCPSYVAESASKRYASFQELLDCWCCSDHELSQCCGTEAMDCASVTKDCDECCIDGSVPPSITSQSAQETPVSLSRSRTTSVSLSSFDSPVTRQDVMESSSTNLWQNGMNRYKEGASQERNLLRCIFEQAHSHNEDGSCLAPALTLHDNHHHHQSFIPERSYQHLHTCHWAGCGMQCESVADLANHVNSVHLVAPGQQPVADKAIEQNVSMQQWTQDQAWKCLWDSCQSDPGAGLEDGNLVLQHILQTHVGMGDHPSPATSGAKRKRIAGEGIMESSDQSEEEKASTASPWHPSLLAHDCGCPVSSSGEAAHPCGWKDCSLRFSSHEALTRHITDEHIGSGKAEYECHWEGCSRGHRKFYQKQKILRHLQTHTGHRPFVCDICNRRFSESNTLSQHRRTHTNEKPYVCDYPGCEKCFSVAGSLTIHKRIHTGEKPFKCSWPGCHRAFSESSNLTKHLRVHTGERPFSCPFPGCSKMFSRPDQVARHKKIHIKAQKG